MTAVWWDGPYFHPKEFQGEEITDDLIDSMRVAKKAENNALKCNAAAALESARKLLPVLPARRCICPQTVAFTNQRLLQTLLACTDVPSVYAALYLSKISIQCR